MEEKESMTVDSASVSLKLPALETGGAMKEEKQS